MALFLFLLARAAPAYLPTALSVALRPLFPFRRAQFVQVFPLKPAPFCTLFAGLGSTNKSAISLLLSDSRSVLATLSSPPSFLLSQTLWQILQELSSLSSFCIRLQWVPGHSFLPGNDAADELAKQGALLAPSAISCSLSPLTSRIHSRFFSDWRRTISLKFFFQFPPRNLCSLVMLAVFSLVYAATDTAYCEVLISLGLAESRILPAAPVDTRPRTPLISFCTVQLRTLRRCLFGDSVFLRPLVQTLGSCPASGAPWSSAMPPSLGRGRVTNSSNTCKISNFTSHSDKSRLSVNIAALVNNYPCYVGSRSTA